MYQNLFLCPILMLFDARRYKKHKPQVKAAITDENSPSAESPTSDNATEQSSKDTEKDKEPSESEKYADDADCFLSRYLPIFYFDKTKMIPSQTRKRKMTNQYTALALLIRVNQ
jgi:hypothetical protein